MSTVFAAIFIAVVAVIVFIQRKRLATMQALVLGGSVLPGCVVVEAIVLLVIALLFLLS